MLASNARWICFRAARRMTAIFFRRKANGIPTARRSGFYHRYLQLTGEPVPEDWLAPIEKGRAGF